MFGSLVIAIQIDAVQTFITKRLASYFSKELKTKVSIDGVSIRFVKSIVLTGFYVEDQHGDTLIYANELVASINDISTALHTLDVSRVILKEGKFNLVHYKGEIHDNLHFISEYFSSGNKTSTATGKPWKIKVKDLTLKNFSFKNEVQGDIPLANGVDFSHLNIRSINGDFTDFDNGDSSLMVKIGSLSFEDKSGFSVQKFSSQASLSSTEINLKKLLIQTPHSDISTDLVFRFDSLPCFDEFTSQIAWESTFRKSKVSFTDIAFFAPELYGLDKAVSLDGNFNGKVNNFKGKNVTIKWGSSSLFRGSIAFRGLPAIDNTYMDIHAEEIVTNKSDVEWLPIPPFEKKINLVVPQNLAVLGKVTFKGKFSGFFTDFVAFGNFNTAIGSISSDLNLKYNESTKSSEYSGHLSASQFDAGKIALISDLGKVTFSVNIKGKGLRLDNINANLNGVISQLQFRNYNYQNIEVDGEIAKKLFNGSLKVDEKNVNFDFLGSVDYRGKLPLFNFIANVNSANLDVLNLFNTKENTVLQTTIRSNFSGNKPDNVVGDINIKNTNLLIGKKLYHINSFDMTAEKIGNIRTFDIKSDNLDAFLRGEFELTKLGDAFKEIIPRYLPSVILPQKSFFSNQNFTFDVHIKNLNVFTETFFPSWDFAANTLINGHFNTRENDFSLHINSDWIRFKSFTFQNFKIGANGKDTELEVITNSTKVLKDGADFALFPELGAKAKYNKVNFVLRIADNDSAANRAHLEGAIDFSSASNFSLKIDSSLLIVDNNRWKLDNENGIRFDSSSINIQALSFTKNQESVSISGSIGKNPDEKLKLLISGFGLNQLTSLLNSKSTKLGGELSGEINLKDAYGKFQLETDLDISNLSINDDTLGNANINSRYKNNEQIITSDINVVKGSATIIDIKGDYYLNREIDNLDFKIKLNNLYLHPLERYVEGIMTEVYGKVTADLNLTGTVGKPVFNGSVDLNKTSLIVDYLKTRYSFTTTVSVKENAFIVKNLNIVDVNNNIAIANGKVTHNYFNNFRFDVELQANRFQVLNTTLNDNILYYGKANASGYAHFYGPIDNMNMDISLSPDKGTVINIPLNTTEDLTTNDFITFIDRSTSDSEKVVKGQVDLSGIRLNMNLDLNRNALINIIFDEKIGDVISGSGRGSLRLDINTAGNFNMYGTYVIDQGDYLFTLQNLINKKFSIDPGGRITWAGDPYEATVDLSAVYTVHTSTLYNVIQDSTYKRRVPVDCRLHLTNKLMNPIINYEITVRGLSPSEEGLVNTKLNSEENINMQMLGLLVFNQFLPSPGTNQSVARFDPGAGAGASASELLSNQVSNWLGQISKDVNIGLNYRAKDTYTNEEIKLIFSKSLLNDRLLIEGNVGYLSDEAYLSSNVVGDFYAEYKVSPDGRFRLKGFNRSNADDIINYSQAPYSQGVGFFYRKEFNSIKDLFVKMRSKQKEEPK